MDPWTDPGIFRAMSIASRPAAPPAFRPAPGLSNPHAQTIGGKLLRPELDIPLRRERLELPDGDFVDLDYAGEPDAVPASAPHVVVLHGLEGSASRRYMRTTYRALLDEGLRPVGLNFRGCSGEPNRTARAYHSGETGDLRRVLELLRSRGLGPAGVVGWSLGGNVTLKLLGELGEAAEGLVAAGAALSVPFDLAAGADTISDGLMGRVYTTYFLRSLKRKLREKGSLGGDPFDIGAAGSTRTLRQFDDAVTAPLHGFDDAADYYARSSAAAFIAGIRVPTLVVHALDDPFLPRDRIPTAALASNPAVTALLPEKGGHCGFITGSLRRPEVWAEPRVARFLAERLGAR